MHVWTRRNLFGNPYKSVTDAEFYASVRKVVSRKEKEYFDVALTKVSVLEPILNFGIGFGPIISGWSFLSSL